MSEPGHRARVAGRVAFGAALVLSLVVFFTPGSYVPQGFDLSDKLIHAGLFALLALTGLLAGLSPWPLLVLLVAYAGLSEVLQAVLPINRDGDVLDAVADSLGASLAMVATLAVRARRRSGAA